MHAKNQREIHFYSQYHVLRLSFVIVCKALQTVSFFSCRKALFKACQGVTRHAGSIWSMLQRSSSSPRSRFDLGASFILHWRFMVRTSFWFCPGNKGCPQIKLKQMAPRLNISLSRPSLAVQTFLILRISGATNPGVPQRTKRQLGSSMKVASPKSTILTLSQFYDMIMFYGFMSRCTILCRENSLSPFSSPFIILRLCSAVVSLCLRRKFYRLVPSANSIDKQREFLVSYTPQSVAMFGFLTRLISLISLAIDALPSPLNAIYFMNALMATGLLHLMSSAKYTVAKFPLPIFLTGLKNS